MIRIRNDRYLSGIRIIIRNIGYRILECDSIRQSDTIALIQFQDRLGITKDVIATIKGTRIFNVVFGLCLRDIDLSKITESVIKQRNRIFIIIRILIPHHHADQLHAILLRAGYQRASRHISITGLTSYQIRIGVFSAGNQFHFVDFHNVIRLSLRGQDVQHVGHGHFAQCFVGKKCLADHRQIIGTGVMILIGKTVGIDKMRIHTSQFLRPLVHDVAEILPGRPRDMFRHRKRYLIRRTDQYGIQTLFHGQLLPGFNGNMVAARVDVMYRVVGEIHDLIHAAALRGDQCRQYLGGTGGILLLVNIFRIQDCSGIRIDQDRRLRTDHRARGPVVHRIGLYRQ